MVGQISKPIDKAKDVAKNKVILYTRISKNSNLTPWIIPRSQCLKGEFEGKVFKDGNTYSRFSDVVAKSWGWHNLRHRRASIWMNSGIKI